MMTALLLCFALLAAAPVSPQQKYIEKYAVTAVREMYRSGVPASITLAQGILESGSGRSRLASEGNNHFGIKCHDWKGRSMRVDDDEKNECFRVYDDADQSFRDHSDFLRYRDRYKLLFEYEITDYKSWAYGLKKAGYATAPAYAESLIRIIEENGLSRFDTMSSEEVESFVSQTGREEADADVSAGKSVSEEAPASERRIREEGSSVSERENEADGGRDLDRKHLRKDKSKRRSADKEKAAAKRRAADKKKSGTKPDKQRKTEVPGREEIPDSPLSIEESRPLSAEVSERYTFSLSRRLAAKNGVPFIYAAEGETYESIALNNRLFIKEILAYNDLDAELALTAGTVVYLQPKKTQAQKGLDKYVVEEDGEQLRDICQRFAVRMKSIQKINDFAPGHVLRSGDTVLLRKSGR